MNKDNNKEFVEVVLGRLFPEAKVDVRNDPRVSTSGPSIRFALKDYKPVELDQRLFLDRYERYGVTAGDAMTVTELRNMGAVPNPPPVSDGQGIPAADAFAPPEGLPTPDRFGK